ncbi:MAG: DUF4167 domain-containing protein [Proteobacteria bacterium]|nr:DUF4167 domain-containing protein [Pseudomonadota bacterium]
MRPGNNNNRRGRNRGQRKPHGGMPNKSQNFDSGAETRVRGNVYQVLEKYLQLARDAGVAGDRVAAENFLQHADHYYRVITAMNDGQRPRVGGREISVADVNVQNVSQGLSAALYSGGPSQPSMSDNAGNQTQSQGNGAAPRGGENFNGQNGNAGNGQGNDAQGEGSHGDDGQGGDQQGEAEGGNYQQRPQQGQGRDRDRNRQRRDFRQNDGQRDNREARQNDGRQNDNRQQHDSRQGEFRDRGNNNQPAVTEQQPEAAPSAPAPQVADEQPDYPEHLLPPTSEAPAEAPRAARAPRPRQQRTRRPRAAEGDGEGTAEAVPATEVSE